MYFFVALFLFATSSLVSSQNAGDVSSSLDRFALEFLAKTCSEAGESLNLALSPSTVWTLMAIVAEGARNNTARELETTLGIPSSGLYKDRFRLQYQDFTKYLRGLDNSQGITLDITNSIFTTTSHELKQTFKDVAKTYYNVDVTPVDFRNVPNAVSVINKKVSDATRGRIPSFVNSDDVTGATIFMTSTLFFKGLWKTPFNRSETRREPFFDERGNQIGEVDMMFQAYSFPFSVILGSRAMVVELPYVGDRVAMIVILPKKSISLLDVLQDLANKPFSELLDTLEKASINYKDEDVMVHLPKFKVASDLNLNRVLDAMGIRDVFNADRADLLGIFPHYLHVSRLIQQAQIEVDEDGTTASASTGAAFQNKITPPKVIANRPFAFILYDKGTKSILFAGKISNPNRI